MIASLLTVIAETDRYGLIAKIREIDQHIAIYSYLSSKGKYILFGS